jgi:hypothetical protein
MRYFITFFMLMLILFACGNEKKGADRKAGWNENTLLLEEDSCIESFYTEPSVPVPPVEDLKSYCDCAVDDISYKFPYAVAAASPDSVVLQDNIAITQCRINSHLP